MTMMYPTCGVATVGYWERQIPELDWGSWRGEHAFLRRLEEKYHEKVALPE